MGTQHKITPALCTFVVVITILNLQMCAYGIPVISSAREPAAMGEEFTNPMLDSNLESEFDFDLKSELDVESELESEIEAEFPGRDRRQSFYEMFVDEVELLTRPQRNTQRRGVVIGIAKRVLEFVAHIVRWVLERVFNTTNRILCKIPVLGSLVSLLVKVFFGHLNTWMTCPFVPSV